MPSFFHGQTVSFLRFSLIRCSPMLSLHPQPTAEARSWSLLGSMRRFLVQADEVHLAAAKHQWNGWDEGGLLWISIVYLDGLDHSLIPFLAPGKMCPEKDGIFAFDVPLGNRTGQGCTKTHLPDPEQLVTISRWLRFLVFVPSDLSGKWLWRWIWRSGDRFPQDNPICCDHEKTSSLLCCPFGTSCAYKPPVHGPLRWDFCARLGRGWSLLYSLQECTAGILWTCGSMAGADSMTRCWIPLLPCRWPLRFPGWIDFRFCITSDSTKNDIPRSSFLGHQKFGFSAYQVKYRDPWPKNPIRLLKGFSPLQTRRRTCL